MTYAVEIKNLKKTYPNGVQALKGVDLKVQKGDFFALLGPNGAGKSTLLKIISTVTKKTAGSVLIGGVDLEQDAFNSKMRLGITPQEVNLNIFEKAVDVLTAQAGYFGIPRKQAKKKAFELLQAMNLADKADSTVRELSGGMKRRLMIARAIVHDPEILILDEPTAGVDIEIRHSMWEYIKEVNRKGMTILLTTHYLEEAEQLCKNISIIDHGEILMNDSIDSLLKSKYRKSFILDTSSLDGVDLDFEDLEIKIVGDRRLEVLTNEDEKLNNVFDKLTSKNVTVYNLRNKTNRLEELFLKLTS